MNDKCAAGTGRFLKLWQMLLKCLCLISVNFHSGLKYYSYHCPVYRIAESEVISLVGEGKPMDEIAAGIQLAVAKRCFVMAKNPVQQIQLLLQAVALKMRDLKSY